jgi:hypothetical protein
MHGLWGRVNFKDIQVHVWANSSTIKYWKKALDISKIWRWIVYKYLHGCLCVLFILYILVGVCASYIIFLISIEFKASYNVEIFKYINILPVNKNILLVWRILVHLRAWKGSIRCKIKQIGRKISRFSVSKPGGWSTLSKA